MALLPMHRTIAFGLATSIVAIVACGPTPADSLEGGRETSARRAEALVSASTHYVGVGSMPAKQLALTFDDGPGPRTSALSTYLKSEGIRAVFFVNGACVAATALPNNSCATPMANAATILTDLAADGHLVANHTTTHRDIASIPSGQRIQELSETDTYVTTYGHAPYNRSLFRAPFGSWNASVFATLSTSSMSHYVGPIYWDIGGSSDQYPNAAADWACFQGQLDLATGGPIHAGTPDQGYATTDECAAAYLSEIDAVGRGIVLMHDPYGWSGGNTLDMVKKLVPSLKAAGYTFVRADEIPAISNDFPACADTGCVACSGPASNQCTSCVSGRYLSNGTCHTCGTCNAGTYPSGACTATANTVCAGCDPSCTTCSGAGPAACTQCAPGRHLTNGRCEACTACPGGTYASTACTPTTDTICAPCAACTAGTYASTACSGAADAVCAPCPAGTASSTPGAITCSPCAPGTHSNAGATACAACESCDDGDSCTEDTCSPTTGCVHGPIAGCVSDLDGGSNGAASSSGSNADGSSSGSNADGTAGSNPTGGSGCQAAGPSRSSSWLACSAIAVLAVTRRRRDAGRRARG